MVKTKTAVNFCYILVSCSFQRWKSKAQTPSLVCYTGLLTLMLLALVAIKDGDRNSLN